MGLPVVGETAHRAIGEEVAAQAGKATAAAGVMALVVGLAGAMEEAGGAAVGIARLCTK